MENWLADRARIFYWFTLVHIFIYWQIIVNQNLVKVSIKLGSSITKVLKGGFHHKIPYKFQLWCAHRRRNRSRPNCVKYDPKKLDPKNGSWLPTLMRIVGSHVDHPPIFLTSHCYRFLNGLDHHLSWLQSHQNGHANCFSKVFITLWNSLIIFWLLFAKCVFIKISKLSI